MLLLRIFASLLVIGATSLMGFEKAKRVKERVTLLKELKSSLMMLQTEIQFTMTPLPEAIQSISESMKGYIKEFYIFIASRLNEKKGETVSQIFSLGINEILKKSDLKMEDIQILFKLSKSLGTSDIEGQMRAISLNVEYLNEHINQAIELKEKNEKMYKVLGVLSGLSIVIVLF